MFRHARYSTDCFAFGRGVHVLYIAALASLAFVANAACGMRHFRVTPLALLDDDEGRRRRIAITRRITTLVARRAIFFW